ncbi:MAG TPA: hypothetical protein VGR55_06555 [Candidatus Acidoferrum sp.]|nr:hypothetical protein [Candidatus Acidoferrum sp.]
MLMREVRVYDGDFPTPEQMLAGGPGAVFPKEVWLQQVQPGKFAVRYKDFKTGLARNPAGELARSLEICRIFSSLEEARADSRNVVHDHWVVVCVIYDHTGAEVDTISNKRQLNKHGAAIYSLILLGIVFCALAGMGLVWILYRVWLLFAPPSTSVHKLPASGWLYWLSYATAGILLVALLVYLRFRWFINRAVSRTYAKLSSAISPEDKKRFQELNYLHLSRDPAERERFVKLSNEYQERIREALKK